MLMNFSKIDADIRVGYLLTNLDDSIFESVDSSVCSKNCTKMFFYKFHSTVDKYLNRLNFSQELETNFSGIYDKFA